MNKTRIFHTFAIVIAFIATVLAISFGSYFRSGLTMTIGEPAGVLVRVPPGMVVEDFQATSRNRQEALALAQGLTPHNTANPAIWPQVENNLRILRESITGIRTAYALEHAELVTALYEWEDLIAAVEAENLEQSIRWEESRSQAITAGASPEALPPPPDPIPLPIMPEFQGYSLNDFINVSMPMWHFSEAAQLHLVQMSYEEYNQMWDFIFQVAQDIQTSTVIGESITVGTVRNVQTSIFHLVENDPEGVIETIVVNRLLTNAIPDEERNNFEFERQAGDYEQVVHLEGHVIAHENDIVTANMYNMMLSLGMLRVDSLQDSTLALIGVLIVVAALFLANVMYLTFYRPNIAKNKKEVMLLLTLYLLALGLVWALSEFNLPFFPLLIFSMLVAVLIDRRVAAFFTFSMVFICYFVVDGSLSFMLFYTISGLLICLLSRFTTERSKVFFVGSIVMALQFVLSIAIMLIVERNLTVEDIEFTALVTPAAFSAVSGLLTVIICTGSLPLWETFFGVVTPVKMLDLTNPTNPLLRRLTIEAPGTYHHSLIVANLAETAAYDIGANPHAARVGGYYHDVGKLKFPHYFAENLDGENPHDHLDPINSAQLIISHVSFGLTLASEHRLPQFVRDIIKEHHGTTQLMYFYSKARERDPQIDEKDYRYPYTIPQTRESACVMLADSVEAAARVMIPKLSSVDEVQTTIRNIIQGKLNDGQLAESQLSIKDVLVIEQSFFRVLKGMYHERIAYPKAPPKEVKA